MVPPLANSAGDPAGGVIDPGPRGARRPRVCILALSAVADDPRVRRQGDAFAHDGWEVVAVGLPGASSAAPGWPVLCRAAGAVEDAAAGVSGSPFSPEPPVANGTGRPGPLARGRDAIVQARKAAVGFAYYLYYRGLGLLYRLRYAARLQLVRLRPRIADAIYWSFSQNIRDIYNLAQAVEPDLWLANDWSALPIAARLAAEKGGRYAYDTHEFAREEYSERRRWRLWQRPFVCAIEERHIRAAAVVSAVSAGIGERLERIYGLPQPPLVIRNTPAFELASFRPTGARIRVLYHGIVAPGRGLEAAIDSVALWREEFDLTIRGPENGAFSAALRARIREQGLADRVALVPPVPMTALVREAQPFDIGFFALPGHSRHNEFALPNKFFEYVMAGLALVVSELPEMARLVQQYGLGVLMPSLEIQAIAAAMNGLDRERIDSCKRNSLKAAHELCWECESARMLAAYRALLPRAQAPRPGPVQTAAGSAEPPSRMRALPGP